MVPVIPPLPSHDDTVDVTVRVSKGDGGDSGGSLGSSNLPKFLQGRVPGFMFMEGVLEPFIMSFPFSPLALRMSINMR